MGYVPSHHRLRDLEQLKQEDLEDETLLVLEDGHCFRNQALSLCSLKKGQNKAFDLKSGSFETLINLSNEGLGMTLVPYLNTLNLSQENKANLRYFEDPPPARKSAWYSQVNLKFK